jgi:hypothetical protein
MREITQYVGGLKRTKKLKKGEFVAFFLPGY